MEFDVNKPLRVFEAFGGYGSQSLAFKRLKEYFPEFDFKVVGYSDIEPTAITAYMALHKGENIINYGDISQIIWKEVPDFDFFTYSWPCTDVSAAGLQQGFKRDSGTRSSLLWECERAIKEKRPKYLLMENVKSLTQKKFMADFTDWLDVLEGLGYVNYWKVLDSSNFGVPQHRERVFCISIYREKGTPIPNYEFPKEFPLELCLRDVLEENVDEKYFLSDEMLVRFCEKSLEESENGGTMQFLPDGDEGLENFIFAQ